MSAPSGLATVCDLNVEGSEGRIWEYYYAHSPSQNQTVRGEPVCAYCSQVCAWGVLRAALCSRRRTHTAAKTLGRELTEPVVDGECWLFLSKTSSRDRPSPLGRINALPWIGRCERLSGVGNGRCDFRTSADRQARFGIHFSGNAVFQPQPTFLAENGSFLINGTTRQVRLLG
jgi:hypothetical protein